MNTHLQLRWWVNRANVCVWQFLSCKSIQCTNQTTSVADEKNEKNSFLTALQFTTGRNNNEERRGRERERWSEEEWQREGEEGVEESGWERNWISPARKTSLTNEIALSIFRIIISFYLLLNICAQHYQLELNWAFDDMWKSLSMLCHRLMVVRVSRLFIMSTHVAGRMSTKHTHKRPKGRRFYFV